MPVEIRELIIRAVVDDGNDRRGGGPARQQGAEPAQVREAAYPDTDALVEECVRQVLKIIKKNGER